MGSLRSSAVDPVSVALGHLCHNKTQFLFCRQYPGCLETRPKSPTYESTKIFHEGHEGLYSFIALSLCSLRPFFVTSWLNSFAAGFRPGFYGRKSDRVIVLKRHHRWARRPRAVVESCIRNGRLEKLCRITGGIVYKALFSTSPYNDVVPKKDICQPEFHSGQLDVLLSTKHPKIGPVQSAPTLDSLRVWRGFNSFLLSTGTCLSSRRRCTR